VEDFHGRSFGKITELGGVVQKKLPMDTKASGV
jgi:hypothetical protein